MEIRNNSVGSNGPDQIDLTKANRESIRERAPSPPDVPKQKTASDEFTPVNPKRIKNARADFIRDASVLKRVADARDRYASVHKRVADARDRFAKQAATPDLISFSNSAQELSETAIAPRPNDVNVASRAQRVSDLKAQYQGGQLDVESLVAETAYRMLGGE